MTQAQEQYQPKTGERAATGRVISSAVMTDDEQDKLDAILGQKLADALHLKRDETHRDRWATTWGSKTSLGLWRTVKRMIENPEDL